MSQKRLVKRRRTWKNPPSHPPHELLFAIYVVVSLALSPSLYMNRSVSASGKYRMISYLKNKGVLCPWNLKSLARWPSKYPSYYVKINDDIVRLSFFKSSRDNEHVFTFHSLQYILSGIIEKLQKISPWFYWFHTKSSRHKIKFTQYILGLGDKKN